MQMGHKPLSPLRTWKDSPRPGALGRHATGGLPDSQSQAMDFYGSDRLGRLLTARETDARSAALLLDAVLADVRRFTAGAPQHDDITAVAIKVL